MKRTFSLRFRLFVIILSPLLVIALLLSLWRIAEARATAEQMFDRSLLLTAVAVARDVDTLDGDAISFETQRLLDESAGGPVRYHVYAPDGMFVIGYAVPPVPMRRGMRLDQPVTYLDVVHRGREVRVLRMQDEAEMGGIAGRFTVTVWQDLDVRAGFAREMALRNLAVISALIGSLAVIVWFGVNLGLKPLLELEDAISRRGPQDLNPIRRAVPREAHGIVLRLNALFEQTQGAIRAQNAFVSDAAHQLRNPLAGIRALGDSILTAGSLEDAHHRAEVLVRATDQASTLANRLLSFERIRAVPAPEDLGEVALVPMLQTLAQEMAARLAERAVGLRMRDRTGGGARLRGDPVMLREMLTNLIDNALVHGGADLSEITVTLEHARGDLVIEVADNGIGLARKDIPTAMARFGQVRPGIGSGLGLPIADAVARRHGGTFRLLPDPTGFRVRIAFAQDAPARPATYPASGTVPRAAPPLSPGTPVSGGAR